MNLNNFLKIILICLGRYYIHYLENKIKKFNLKNIFFLKEILHIPSIYLLINVAANREADKLHIEMLEYIAISMQFSISKITFSNLIF